MTKREYCKNCRICKVFTAEENKVIAKKSKKIYYNEICKDQDKSEDANKYVKNEYTQNIFINPNITVNNNPLLDYSLNFIFTNDRYYYVKMSTHGITVDDQINRLKYIFTFLMCGIDGKSIFPYESDHSEAKSHPVSAAIYSLTNENGLPILHGLIRYKHIKCKSYITIKQLQAYNKSLNPHHHPKTEVRMLELYENKKNYVSIKDINNTITLISEEEVFGSDINKFYLINT